MCISEIVYQENNSWENENKRPVNEDEILTLSIDALMIQSNINEVLRWSPFSLD